jgi:DNA invertase Pin-like site-specific DNA recombinase
MKPQPVAYSYIRFSNPAQATGDSLRRQTEAARAWCLANKYRLDESTTLRDLGTSAFVGTHRSNPDRYALAGFLKLVEGGKVPRGSALIVESLDRLSREHIRPALSLVLNLIEAGVRLVQLAPVETVYDEKVEPMALMMAIMELSRGHSESSVKSERVGKAWKNKKVKIREGDHLYTQQAPAWVRVVGQELKLIPERAKVVKRIFDMAANGYGLTAVVHKLVADKVPAFGKSGVWKRSYVGAILRDRRAVGEFQPRAVDKKTANRKPDGEPVAGYYPAVVSEDEYHAARAGADDRHNHKLKSTGDRKPKRETPRLARSNPQTRHAGVNLFTGLVVSARDSDDHYHAVQRVVSREDRTRSRKWVLLNSKSAQGETKCLSFPLAAFESAILGRFKEIDPREIVGTVGRPSEALTLAGELGGVETQIGALEVELMTGSVPSLARALRVLEDKRADLAARLAEAKAKEATPMAAAWGEAGSLLDALAAAPDKQDTRMRLRSALRRIVERITLLIVPKGRSRLAAVRVDFEGGRHRDYIIAYTPPHYGYHGTTPERTAVGSAKWPAALGEIDLRHARDAKAVEKELAAVDVEKLAAALAEKGKAPAKARKRA